MTSFTITTHGMFTIPRVIRVENLSHGSHGVNSQPGAYFVTICTKKRECILGQVMNEKVALSELGGIAESVWLDLPTHYPGIELDAFVIMPNHVHGIILIVGAGLKPAPTKKCYPLSEIIRGFKTFSSRHINEICATTGMPVWQPDFYEHVHPVR